MERAQGSGNLHLADLRREGLVAEFSGNGTVYLQTRSNQAFLDWLVPRLPTAHASSGGRGGIGGIIGNVLGGR